MKIDFQRIKDFVIRHHIMLVVTIVPLGAIIFVGALITYNQSQHFCFSCHENRGPYVYFDSLRAVHKDIDESTFNCIKCHNDKTVQNIYVRNFAKLHRNAQLVGNLQAKSIRRANDVYTSDQCLNCHPDRIDVMEREPYLLKNEKLRKIGLRFNKKLHYRFEYYRYEDQNLYRQLSTKDNLTNEEQQELELLDKIRIGNCGQCHLRKKQDESFTVDKQVNFIARNPINCAGCHEHTNSVNHPGQPMEAPTKEVCQKCHHGKIHGKFRIFKADCDAAEDTEHCVKCHPYYTPEVTFTSNKF